MNLVKSCLGFLSGQLLLHRHRPTGERFTLAGAVRKNSKLTFQNSIKLTVFGILFFSFVGCETPTKVSELDLDAEERVFSKVEYGKEFKLKHAIIVDVRSRFDYNMSRLPRSFFAHAPDWDLRGYHGKDLQNKVKELQRILALKGIEPYTRVVILGKALKGQGEEFLLASTLKALGVSKISYMSEQQANKAFATRGGLPPVENAPSWSRELKYQWACEVKPGEFVKADVKIEKPSQFFNSNLSVKPKKFPKTLRPRVSASKGYWAFGLALHFKDQGRQTCVF